MNFTKTLGIDRAVVWINISTCWTLARGTLSAFFVVTYLTVEQQGLWYTFSNLAALSVFAELGFSVIVSQFISHEYSKLNLSEGRLIGESYNLDRLVSLARYAIKVYVGVIIGAIGLLTIVGFLYFRQQAETVFLAWFFFSVTSGLNLFVTLLAAIYRGLDNVAETQRVTVASAAVAAFSTWLALYAGLNVWALPVGSAAGMAVLLWLIIRLSPRFWLQLHGHHPSRKFTWAKEIIRLQGKYALTFASGYFIFNLLVPAVFKFEGAAAAGQLGLTLAVVAALQSVATASVTANVPKINMLIASTRHNEAYRLILKNTLQSGLLYGLGALLLVAGVMALERAGLYADRFLNMPLLGLVLSYQLAPTLTSGASAYLRAHKEEPHLPLALVQSALTATAIFFLLPRMGLFWLLIAMNLIFWLVAFPWVFHMLAEYRDRNRQSSVTTIHVSS